MKTGELYTLRSVEKYLLTDSSSRSFFFNFMLPNTKLSTVLKGLPSPFKKRQRLQLKYGYIYTREQNPLINQTIHFPQ